MVPYTHPKTVTVEDYKINLKDGMIMIYYKEKLIKAIEVKNINYSATEFIKYVERFKTLLVEFNSKKNKK